MPRWSACSTWAPGTWTSGRAGRSAGWCWPTRKATSSASCAGRHNPAERGVTLTSEEHLQESVQRVDEEAAREPVTTRTVFRWSVAGALGVLAVYLGYRAVLLVTDILVQVIIAAFIAVSL